MRTLIPKLMTTLKTPAVVTIINANASVSVIAMSEKKTRFELKSINIDGGYGFQ